MKKAKRVSSREFQYRFSDISLSLKPGEAITVTRHGRIVGSFIKAVEPRKAPDNLANLEKLGYSAKAGKVMIDEICGLS